MRRILIVGFLAVLAAAALWVLSEVEVSPVPGVAPSPSPATPAATPSAGNDGAPLYFLRASSLFTRRTGEMPFAYAVWHVAPNQPQYDSFSV